jgi:hypothetical protein
VATRPLHLHLSAIYHFTDVDNLEGILAARSVRPHRAAPCVVDIADEAIKNGRTRVDVPCGPGGKVCDYVPFYFAPRSPMLFRIKCGGVEGVSSDQRRIVYLVSSTEAVLDPGHRCVFTDGNAAAAFTAFHEDPELLSEVVDWPLMRAHYWANTPEDSDRRRRRCAEFLVHEALPLEFITEIGVYDDDVRLRLARLTREAGLSIAVRVRSDWYF